MKKILVALFCLAGMGLTSCLVDDDDNQSLTPQEIGQCLNTIKGNYTGKMLFENHNPDNASDIVDTLDIAWSITADTMIVINAFPQTVILDRINEEPMKTALEEADPAPLRAVLAFYSNNPISFLAYPYSVVYDIELNGTAHKAILAFWVNTYSYGLFDKATQVLQVKLQAAGLYLDENTTHNYLTNSDYDNSSIPIIITNSNLSK